MNETQKAQYIAQRNLKPYNGNLPYIFISYSHLDWRKAMLIIERLMHDGYRVWFDEGIDPGTEWGENIAGHVEHCEVFIALISRNYLNSGNCLNELDYSRKKDRQRLLIYLENVELPGALDMQHSRFQAIHQYTYQKEEDFYAKLYEGTVLEKCRERSGSVDTLDTFKDSSSQHGNFPVKPVAIAAIVVAGVFAAMILLTGRSDSGDSDTVDSVAEEDADNSGDDVETTEEEQMAEDDDSGETVEEVEEAGEIVVETGEEEAKLEEETEVVEETVVAEEEADTTYNIPDGAIEYDGHYYLCVENDGVSWDDAEELCEAAGGHLMTINSSAEQEFLEINLSTSEDCWWIGACYDTSGIWSWVTGEPMSYSNWTLPSRSTSTSYRYMGIWGSDWQYFNEEGKYIYGGGIYYEHIIGYICEWEAEESEDDSDNDEDAVYIPDDAIEYGGHSYRKYLTEGGFTWEQAEELCELLGGHLMTITSEDEQDFMEINLSGDDYWLGGYYDTSGTWIWVTGESMEFTDWATEPTQETSSEYRYMGTWDFDWQYYNEEGKYVYYFGNYVENISGYICEWDTTVDASEEGM